MSEQLTFVEQIKKLRDGYRKDKEAIDKAVNVLHDNDDVNRVKFRKAVEQLVIDNTLLLIECKHDRTDKRDGSHCSDCKASIYHMKVNGKDLHISWPDKSHFEETIKHYTGCVDD